MIHAVAYMPAPARKRTGKKSWKDLFGKTK
jgi:hypothetical protein